MPLPETCMNSGPGALSVITTLAISLLISVGVKVTARVQLCPEASTAPQVPRVSDYGSEAYVARGKGVKVQTFAHFAPWCELTADLSLLLFPHQICL